MKRAGVDVREHNGSVELSITQEDAEAMVIVLDPQDARAIGDKMFKAGCSASF